MILRVRPTERLISNLETKPKTQLRLEIAGLAVELPASEGMTLRCREYRTKKSGAADIIIDPCLYRYPTEDTPCEDGYDVEYMESGFQFYRRLLAFDGMMLHASGAAYRGRAYLFSGPCGRGKSTHTRLWQSTFGNEVRVFNDDKPALRRTDGCWLAYGTPWCGKDGININESWPLGGICFLEQGSENRIRRIEPAESIPLVLEQTLNRLVPRDMEQLLTLLDSLLREIPVFLFENRPDEAAARMSLETMSSAAKGAGL